MTALSQNSVNDSELSAVRSLGRDAAGLEALLARDPAGVYTRMRGTTRRSYVEAAHKLAEWSGLSPEAVCNAAVELATSFAGASGPHVGHFLVGEQRVALESHLKIVVPYGVRIARWMKRQAFFAYLFLSNALSMLMAFGLARKLSEMGVSSASSVTFGVVAWLMLQQSFNELAAHLVSGRCRQPRLPRMDFQEGLPEEAACVLVFPLLLSGESELRKVVASARSHWHRNRDQRLQVCIFTDFVDGSERQTPAQISLLELAKEMIAQLNADEPEFELPFLLLHRSKIPAPGGALWWGRERKRGKLEDLNRAIATGQFDQFECFVGDLERCTKATYVLTLDADSILEGPNAVISLLELHAHPVNSPLDGAAGRSIASGYGVLQPMLELRPPQFGSIFERVAFNCAAWEMSAPAMSSLHQALFGECSYFGKGLYKVRTFLEKTECLPDQLILSHDLPEGSLCRTAMVADVKVLEDAPVDYASDVLRRHRWLRGDWQNFLWLLGARSESTGACRAWTAMSPLARWKLIDVARRDLAPVFAIGLLALASLENMPTVAWIAALCLVVLPQLTSGAFQLRDIVVARTQLRNNVLIEALSSLSRTAWKVVFAIAVLPFEALITVDAVCRSTWRVYVTRKNELQWTSASQTNAAISIRRAVSLLASLTCASAAGLLYWLMGGRPAFHAWNAVTVLLWLSAPMVLFVSSLRFGPGPVIPASSP